MKSKDIETITQELRNAQTAREAGNDGLARVCARRAVGWSIQIWLENKGVTLNSPSAYDYIRHLHSKPNAPEQIAAVLDHMVTKAEENEEDDGHEFPVEIDTFLAEAKWFCQQMLRQEIQI